MSDLLDPSPRPSDDALEERVRRHDDRRRRAEREPVGSPWRTVARVGTLGWLMALPPALGALAGHAIDLQLGSGIAWALGLMFAGLLVAGVVFWRAVHDEDDGRDEEGGA